MKKENGISVPRTVNTKKRLVSVGLFLALGLWFVISVFPFLWTLLTSFKYTVDAFSTPPKWIFEPTVRYYQELWSSVNYGFYLKNSLFVTLFCVVFALVIGTPCGYAIARYSKNSSFGLLCMSLLFRALPGMVLLLPFYFIATQMGLFDTHLILIIVIVATNQPFTIWMQRSFFMTVPVSLDEAAMVDGCTRLQAFLHVVLPTIRTGVITSGLFTGMFAYNDYMLALTFTAKKAVTLPVMISQFGGEDLRYLSVSAAGCVTIALPLIIFVLFMQKYLISGIGAGAVKE